MNSLVASMSAPVLAPFLLLILCAVAGIGTVLLLPAGREGAMRKIGGGIVLVAGVILASTLIRFAAGAGDAMGIYFWLFAGMAIFGALRVITHPRPVFSAIYFLLTTFASAGLFVLLWAEFMAAALILIYAGAILVTYVFVIMLAAQAGTGSKGNELAECDRQSREPVMAATIGFALMAMLLYVIFDKAPVAKAAVAVGDRDVSVQRLAEYLFNHQLINLELGGLILTLAMVGAIVIARRRMWNPQDEVKAERPFEIGEDDPHTLPISGTTNPRQKAYPET